MPTITKKELLEKAFAGALPISGEGIVVAVAEALGYKVLDEPELPKSIVFDGGLRVEGDAGYFAFVNSHFGDGEEQAFRILAETARRYNAKAKVLAVLRELDGNDCMNLHPRIAARRIRAAYED